MKSGLARTKAALSGAAFLFLLASCGGGAALRQNTVLKAQTWGLKPTIIEVRQFALFALLREAPAKVTTLSVYIEGDGAPWPTPHHPPRDPTPAIPTVLIMAGNDPSSAVAYLGRPCQYLDAAALAHCDPAYWDEARFAPAVIAEYEQVLDQLKHQSGAQKLRLIGYSGGGVIAALLAAQRRDVEQWITVGAPLDLALWAEKMSISPLTASLDPAQRPPGSPLPPGHHWVGGKDRIVPATLVQSFTLRHGGTMRTVADFDHVCCWAKHWPRLLEEIHNDP